LEKKCEALVAISIHKRHWYSLTKRLNIVGGSDRYYTISKMARLFELKNEWAIFVKQTGFRLVFPKGTIAQTFFHIEKFSPSSEI